MTYHDKMRHLSRSGASAIALCQTIKSSHSPPALRFWLKLGEGECNCRFRLPPQRFARQRFESGWLFALQ
jgi:hypothetical protein